MPPAVRASAASLKRKGEREGERERRSNGGGSGGAVVQDHVPLSYDSVEWSDSSERLFYVEVAFGEHCK